MSPLVVGILIGLLLGCFFASIFWVTTGLRLAKLLTPAKKQPTLLPALLLAIGAGALFLCAFGTGIYSTYFLLASQPTTATVSEIREMTDSDGFVSHYPVYQYRDASGVEHRDTTTSSDGREFAVGDTIPIRYLKNSPGESRIDYFSYHWMLPLLLGLFSMVALAVSAALRWNFYRQTSLRSHSQAS